VLALLAYLGYRGMTPALPLGPIDSVAVLPFVNASDNPDAQYLGDGITESLINRLSKLPNLRVVPRSLVFRYKDRQTNPAELGAKLGARAVVTGRVAQRGDTLIIGAELVDVATVSQLWGQQYNRTQTDIFSVQEEIAREISRNLRLRLTPEDEVRIGRSYTKNTEAFQLYSKSLHHMRRGTREGYEEAIRLAQQALVADLRQRGTVEEGESEDPGFALAYSALARIYTLQAFSGFVPPREVYPKAKQAALFALQMDDSLADAHGSLAFVRFFYEWDWDTAESEFRRALELEPGDDEIRKDYSGYLLAMGRADEAIAEIRRARELDPVSDEHSALLAAEYFWTRRYDEALAELGTTLGLNPESSAARLRPQIQSILGQHDEAIAGYREYLAGGGEEDLFNPTLAYFLAAGGRREEALASASDGTSPVQSAWIHAALGELDRAFELLESAYEERAINLLWVKAQPWFDPLRSDRRFDDLLRRMNLPER
jgi:TolB-like protein